MSIATQRPPVRNPTPIVLTSAVKQQAPGPTEWTMTDVLDRLNTMLPDHPHGAGSWTPASFVSVAALPRMLRGLDPAPIFALLAVDDLAMLVRTLVRTLRSKAPSEAVAARAMDYLERSGLAGGEAPVEIDKPRGGELARLAGMLCQQAAFQAFARADSAAGAADWIRGTCEVNSRAELDHNPVAAHRFHELVRKPYVESQGKLK